MRWGIRMERETHTFCRPESCLLLWVTVINSICGLHRLPCEGPQWSNSRKSRFLINMSKNLNRKFLHLSILKMVYLMRHLQNIGDWVCSVSFSLPFGKCLWEVFCFLFFFFKFLKDIGEEKMTTILLTCFYLNHAYYNLRPC